MRPPFLRSLFVRALIASGAVVIVGCEDENCGIDRIILGDGPAIECRTDDDCADEACGDATRCNVIIGLCEIPEDAGPDD